MKKQGAFVVAAAVLLLTGCASTTAEAPAPAASSTPSASAEAAPIPEATETSAPDASRIDPDTAEADFVASLDYFWQGEKPAEEQWIGAGRLACEQLTVGTARDQIEVVEGGSEDALQNNATTITYATQYFCPQFQS